MSSVILTNWTVYYQSDAGTAGGGAKQIRWTGGSTGSNSLNQLYSALMDLFDNAAQNDADDGIPIEAITPTLYEIGAIDAGDRRPWFIDRESAKHLSGGGLQSTNWTRDTGTRTTSHGIIRITRSGSNITTNDIGATITNTTHNYDGWLLFVLGDSLWIRPDTDAAADDWSTGTGTITCNSHSDTQTSAAVSDDSIWTNLYTLGTIEPNTELYIYQSFAPITKWWGTGHFDILVLVESMGIPIDDGLITVYAHQYSKTYDHYTLDASVGGRIPVPLATASDTNNAIGYRTFTGTGGSGTFNVGNYIYVGTNWASATKKGVLTAVNGYTLTYYLVGDFTDFVLSDSVKEYVPATGSDDATCTATNPTDFGPTTTPSTNLTISFGGVTHNLNNGNGAVPYSVTLNLQNTIPITDLYQRLKYLTRQGQLTDIDTETSQSLIGQSYTAIGDLRLLYDGQTTNFVEGETVNGQTSGATGIITSDHNTNPTGALILRDVRGTFVNDENLRSGATVRAVANLSSPAEVISPIKVSPFGTFAGGKFFGARGVLLTNVPGIDANKYELIDTLGTRQAPPISIAITINNVNIGDKVTVFRTTGNNEIIDRTTYTSVASGNDSGNGNFVVQQTIAVDTPPSGVLRVVNNTINDEDLYAYDSWSGSTFTLASGVTLVDTYTAADTAYVPYIQTTATGTSVSQAVTYAEDRYVLVIVRAAGTIPFKVAGQVNSTGLTLTAIRTPDSIYQ